MVLASQQERNSSTVKLDFAKWNMNFFIFFWSHSRWFEALIYKNILWYILPSVLGRKSNGCLERELRSGIVFVSAFEGFVLYCNAEAFRGEITSLCLAINSSLGKQSIEKIVFMKKFLKTVTLTLGVYESLFIIALFNCFLTFFWEKNRGMKTSCLPPLETFSWNIFCWIDAFLNGR